MGRKKKECSKQFNLSKVNSPKLKKKCLKKRVTSLNNSCLIETLSLRNKKNFQFLNKTFENTSSLPKTKEVACDNTNIQLLNQTIDLCQDDSSINLSNSNNQPFGTPNKTESITEIVDLSKDTYEQNEVIILEDESKMSLKAEKTCEAPVINLIEEEEDENHENENKTKNKINNDTVEINDDILMVEVFKSNAPPPQYTQLSTHTTAQYSLIKSLNHNSNSSSFNWNIRNNRQSQSKLKKSKKKRKLKSVLKIENTINVVENQRHFRVNNPHQENLILRPDSLDIGKNISFNSPVSLPSSGLRPIIIDGSNVAIGVMGKKCRDFSCKKLQICINFFKKRGHKVTAFVPQFRTKFSKSDDPRLLNKLVQDGDVILTPSKMVGGKPIVPYDDRFIVQTAVLKGGIIVSTDNYRDLLAENPAWAETINYRTLPFTWVDNVLMFPNDPLGQHGPSLDEFLRFH